MRLNICTDGGGWKRGEGAQRQGTAGIGARKGRTTAPCQSQFRTASPRKAHPGRWVLLSSVFFSVVVA